MHPPICCCYTDGHILFATALHFTFFSQQWTFGDYSILTVTLILIVA